MEVFSFGDFVLRLPNSVELHCFFFIQAFDHQDFCLQQFLFVSVAAHLRDMRSTSSIDKDIPTINEKLETQNPNINQTHN